MPISRTTPTKLATAPIPRSFDSAFTSDDKSKSSRCTEIFMSAPRHRRKESDLVAGLDRRDGLDHLLIHRRGDAALFAERFRPGAAARAQMRPDGRHRGNSGRQLDLLGVHAELLLDAGEIADRDF